MTIKIFGISTFKDLKVEILFKKEKRIQMLIPILI